MSCLLSVTSFIILVVTTLSPFLIEEIWDGFNLTQRGPDIDGEVLIMTWAMFVFLTGMELRGLKEEQIFLVKVLVIILEVQLHFRGMETLLQLVLIMAIMSLCMTGMELDSTWTRH
jgi:hypothetical protein